MKILLAAFFLAFSHCCQGQTPGVFGLRPPRFINCTPVKDQNMSGTCWSFSSMSLLESELLKKGKGMNDLSEMFIARYSMVRKINRHLELKGQNYFTPGGQFHDAVWVMKNYGMVPEEVFPGKGRGETSHNHAEMDTLLSYFVKECVAEGVTQLSNRQQNFIDSILDHYYGKTPTSFFYKGKTYTPKTYLRDWLAINPDDYVEITSYTHHPFYTKFVLEDKYNWTGDEYYNVPLSDFSAITDYALKSGYTIGWDGDADDPDFNYWSGLAYLPGIINNFQKERQEAFQSQVTLLDHMMHIVASVNDRYGNKWYYIKNSWGNTNITGGYLYMRDDYFKIRTVAIIVNKAAIPVIIRKKMGL
jgi:bleomycin hydrolase